MKLSIYLVRARDQALCQVVDDKNPERIMLRCVVENKIYIAYVNKWKYETKFEHISKRAFKRLWIEKTQMKLF